MDNTPIHEDSEDTWQDLALKLPHMVAAKSMEFKRQAASKDDKVHSAVMLAIARAFEGMARELQVVVEGAMQQDTDAEENQDDSGREDPVLQAQE